MGACTSTTIDNKPITPRPVIDGVAKVAPFASLHHASSGFNELENSITLNKQHSMRRKKQPIEEDEESLVEEEGVIHTTILNEFKSAQDVRPSVFSNNNTGGGNAGISDLKKSQNL